MASPTGDAPDDLPQQVWYVQAGFASAIVEALTAVDAMAALVSGDLTRSDLTLDPYRIEARKVDGEHVHLPGRTVATIVATLRQVVGWVGLDQADMLREVAQTLEAIDWTEAWETLCCPMCQEITCDDGCPLAGVRSWAARAR
jgi:hypothetical protein